MWMCDGEVVDPTVATSPPHEHEGGDRPARDRRVEREAGGIVWRLGEDPGEVSCPSDGVEGGHVLVAT